MNKLLYKAATGIATASLLAQALTPLAFADTTVEISGNGADSDNTATVVQVNETGVFQENNAEIRNDVSVSTNSGGNDANNNTGGDVSIDTGNATSNTTISNTANANVADVSGCCPGDIDVKISGNGFNSDNDAKVKVKSETLVVQENNASVANFVTAKLNTGKNDANNNTGGDVSIDTGNAEANVTLSTKVNKNVAKVGGNNGGELNVEISGNGADSDNDAKVKVKSETGIFQLNNAEILNDVWVKANSGKNDANNNTGGDVSIDTGNAEVDVEVNNLANFNWADVDACGCILDLTVKIKNNGFNSDNDAKVILISKKLVTQENNFDCKETRDACADVWVKSNTGKNDANNNTDGGDPSIDTGNAGADVEVNNTANKNVVGSLGLDGIDLPDLDLPEGFSGLLLLLIGLFS